MHQYLAQIDNPYLSDTFRGLYGFDFVNRIVPSLIVFGLVVGILIFVFMLISGGVAWIASSGNKAALEDARRKIVHALIGLFILLSIWAFIGLINLIFGIDIGRINPIDREPTPGPITIDCNIGTFGDCTCDCDPPYRRDESTPDCVDDFPSCPGQCVCIYDPGLPTETPVPVDGNCVDFHHSTYGDICLCDCPAGTIEAEEDSCNSVYGYPACVSQPCECIDYNFSQALLLHYQLDEGSGTQVNDTAGYPGYDFSTTLRDPSGDTWATQGCGETSLRSNETNGTILGPPSTEGDLFHTPSFTLASWINISENAARWEMIIDNNSSAFITLSEFIGSDFQVLGVIDLYPNCRAGDRHVIHSTQRVPLNEWHHVAFTYDAGTQDGLIYIDGVEGTIDNTGGNIPVPDYPCVYTHWMCGVGVGQNCYGDFDEPNGYIDDIRIYNYALSAGDIMSIVSSCDFDIPCTPAGSSCGNDSECCTNNCSGGTCQPDTTCTPAGGSCGNDSDCCTNDCGGGTCQCAGEYSPCTSTSDCCACSPGYDLLCHPYDSLCHCLPGI